MTKGEMIKQLKAMGIRQGEKGPSTVKLEHMKTTDVFVLWNEKTKTFKEV